MPKKIAKPVAKSKLKKLNGQINVRFFGNFRVMVNDVVINDSSSRARQPWNLLQFLMVHRYKALSRQQLIDALWPDGTSEQPDKALKNLVYRVRSAFAGKGAVFAQQVVLYQGGSYVLNNELDWWFDFEQAEQYFAQAQKEDAPSGERIESMLKAIDLYEGDFLSEQIYEDWVLPYNTYYRSRFFRCVHLVLEKLEDDGRDEDVEFVCNRAISVDPFEEYLHLAYMNALIRQDKKSTALAHYNKMSEMFYREMGVVPNDELRALYAELSSSLQSTVTDLSAIKDALGEESPDNDAFYCDFEVFRSVYRLEARAAQRAGQSVFIVLLTLSDGQGEMEEGEKLTRSMGKLLGEVHANLRRGDVVSRFSLCQYILMLPTITIENAEMVIDRLAEKFRKNCPYPDVLLETRIQPLDPVMD